MAAFPDDTITAPALHRLASASAALGTPPIVLSPWAAGHAFYRQTDSARKSQSLSGALPTGSRSKGLVRTLIMLVVAGLGSGRYQEFPALSRS